MELEKLSIKIYPDNRMDVKNAALYLGYSKKTLAMMRTRGTGPRFIKLGKVYYYKEDLDDWVQAQQRHLSTAF